MSLRGVPASDRVRLLGAPVRNAQRIRIRALRGATPLAANVAARPEANLGRQAG